jgi:hypothetical protein
MNAKKERELFLGALERLLDKERGILEEYRTLADLVKSVPAALLLEWFIIEEDVHFTLLCTIISSLKRTRKKSNGKSANALSVERDNALGWIERLRLKEQAVAGDCHYLKSQFCWEDRDLIDAFLDALVMDSEKHQRFLLTIETTVKNTKTNRLQ